MSPFETRRSWREDFAAAPPTACPAHPPWASRRPCRLQPLRGVIHGVSSDRDELAFRVFVSFGADMKQSEGCPHGVAADRSLHTPFNRGHRHLASSSFVGTTSGLLIQPSSRQKFEVAAAPREPRRRGTSPHRVPVLHDVCALAGADEKYRDGFAVSGC